MTSMHSFDAKTEAKDVVSIFTDSVKGKTSEKKFTLSALYLQFLPIFVSTVKAG